MPKRLDINKIIIIGSGPIVVGQACEFDYSGTQACKSLQEEGYSVVLVNSNPATIMTDPVLSNTTYIEPLTADIIERIIVLENPDAILPTLGGQTGINLFMQLEDILNTHSIRLIGTSREAIERSENREEFRRTMLKIGLDIPKSYTVKSPEEAKKAAYIIGSLPLIIRPSYTLGGTGSGIVYNREELDLIVDYGISLSPALEVLVEEYLVGWKEYEVEVMRDCKDQCLVICSIENFDTMGTHTGDSISVAPAMTLTDKEYQLMRDASIEVIRAIGVQNGCANVQFAVNPSNGSMLVIEINTRLSRSSALASKATGFPIAKIAAKLSIGYSLDELKNDIVSKTSASFEPSIDYVVTKVPRFSFEKFSGVDPTLTTSMKSVGEAMAIGRNLKESFKKALSSLEIVEGGSYSLNKKKLRWFLATPRPERILNIRYALLAGFTVEEIYYLTKIDPWFLYQIHDIIELELSSKNINKALLRRAKDIGLTTIYRLVDTCAAEFETHTPYYYSSYGYTFENELNTNNKQKIMIIGSGPNRIGQGIEFDYCCVHASYALREKGYDTVMVNSNPETVSTDYDTSDYLFLDPLTLVNVLDIYKQQKCKGAIVQFGGQTPINIATKLKNHGIHIMGTNPDKIDISEDRHKFKYILNRIGLKQPVNASALLPQDACRLAVKIGFPILLRPSFVLGGRGMFIIHDASSMKRFVLEVLDTTPGKPVLLDKYLEDTIEIDVDAISDCSSTVICGILEHIEYAGVHSGDAAMVLPPHTIKYSMLENVRKATYSLTRELNIKGIINVQYAIKDNNLYVLEVNLRASRTIPFIAKTIGVPIAKYAASVIAGYTLSEIGFTKEVIPNFWSVKESVFPYGRFHGSVITLSPEMRSTGEVMVIDNYLGMALAKSKMASNSALPTSGNVFFSVSEIDLTKAIALARELVKIGFYIYATVGTAVVLERAGIAVKRLFKLSDGYHPNIMDMLKYYKIDFVITTSSRSITNYYENVIRTEALLRSVCIITTLSFAKCMANCIKELKKNRKKVCCLQNYAKRLAYI